MEANRVPDLGIPETLSALTVSIDQLQMYGANPRTGNVDAIAESLSINGQYRPIVVNSRTGEILAGNHTYLAAKSLGWAEMAVTYVDVDDDQAARIVLVDNRSNDLASYDDAALAELLESVPDLAGTGYDAVALEKLLDDLGQGTVPAFEEDPNQSNLDNIEPKRCPSCGFEWREGPRGEIRPA